MALQRGPRARSAGVTHMLNQREVRATLAVTAHIPSGWEVDEDPWPRSAMTAILLDPGAVTRLYSMCPARLWGRASSRPGRYSLIRIGMAT
jgi:hypothetical protein